MIMYQDNDDQLTVMNQYNILQPNKRTIKRKNARQQPVVKCITDANDL